MAGIRVRHESLRGPMIVAVRDKTQRIPNKYNAPWNGCAACHIPSPGHEGYKTRHVSIDADGEGIISDGVWEGLCHLYARGGCEAVNSVTNPPRIGIDFNKPAGATLTVYHRLQQPITARLLQKIKGARPVPEPKEN